MTRQILALASCALVLTGCGAQEVLEPRDGTVPPGIDLSGTWDIQDNSREIERRVREAIRKTDGVKDDEIFRPSQRQSTTQRSSSQGNVRGGLVHVFLETGKSLKVTQTPDGLFISFDRSVVEEFRFGENRMVSVGEIQAQRVTGWEGDQLVVDSLDRNGMKLTERYRLLNNNAVLERSITFRSKDGQTESVTQLFNRRN
jgi:hypothetical protein